MLLMNGTSDPVVPYDGGVISLFGLRHRALRSRYGPPLRANRRDRGTADGERPRPSPGIRRRHPGDGQQLRPRRQASSGTRSWAAATSCPTRTIRPPGSSGGPPATSTRPSRSGASSRSCPAGRRSRPRTRSRGHRTKEADGESRWGSRSGILDGAGVVRGVGRSAELRRPHGGVRFLRRVGARWDVCRAAGAAPPCRRPVPPVAALDERPPTTGEYPMDDKIRQAPAIDRSSTARDRTIDITTTGRRSGRPRRSEIWLHHVLGGWCLSSPPARPGWYPT